MAEEKRRYTVELFGEMYALVSDEGADHVEKTHALVDSLMREIAAKLNKSSDVKTIAVLAALQASSMVIKERGMRVCRNEAASRLDKILQSIPTTGNERQT